MSAPARDPLVTVVAQDRRTGEIRMVAHASEEALRLTKETGFAHFYSRSRDRLWKKGEESGNVLQVFEVWVDCDADAYVYLVEPRGPTCHTGRASCFFERAHPTPSSARAAPALLALEDELARRRESDADKSYTRSLLDGGSAPIGAKIREEAAELAQAIAEESDARVVSEMADVLYHAMVGLLSRGIPLAEVMTELARRAGTSGHEEKARRE